jgi:hypothetical protein
LGKKSIGDVAAERAKAKHEAEREADAPVVYLHSTFSPLKLICGAVEAIAFLYENYHDREDVWDADSRGFSRKEKTISVHPRLSASK